MARTCIFCGEEIGAFGGKKLLCAGHAEIVCPDCFDKYQDLPAEELAQKILATGRAKYAEDLREYLNYRAIREQEKAEREKNREEEFRSKHPEAGQCPKCGGTMFQYGPLVVKLGDETFLFSDMNRLLTGSLSVRVDRCRECGYSEFYTPNENELII